MSATLPPQRLIAGALPESRQAEDAHEKPSAAQRLAESRERLRQWMLHAEGHHETRRHAHEGQDESASGLWERVRNAPGVGAVLDAVSAWWSSHPLHPAATLAQGMARDAVAPVARRHPFVVVVAAFLAGALLVRLRPWRWIAKPALFGGLGSHLLSRAVAHMPIESWMSAFGSFARARQAGANEATDDVDYSPAPASTAQSATAEYDAAAASS